jgi:hypothetical protein
VNLISMRILAGGKDDSLNVKGAYLEVWADMLGSLGVIARQSRSISPSSTGSTRWSPSPLACGCCRAPGSF